MTNEEILELAKQCNKFHIEDHFFYDFCITFANTIAQRTREECAAVCDGLSGRSYEFDMGRLYAGQAIRSIG